MGWFRRLFKNGTFQGDPNPKGTPQGDPDPKGTFQGDPNTLLGRLIKEKVEGR